MRYCNINDVIQLTGARPEIFNLQKTDTIKFEAILYEWIGQASDMITRFCNQTFQKPIPPTVRNVAVRLTSNIIALAVSRRDTPLIKVDDWNIKITDTNVFTTSLKRDLRDSNLVTTRTTDLNRIQLFTVRARERRR